MYAISLTISYPIQLYPVIRTFEDSPYYTNNVTLINIDK